MKLVREHIEFTRGENPFKSLRIGKKAQIDNWFRTWEPNVDYEIDDNLNIKVKGNLDLDGTKFISLPDNLHIVGYLDLENSEIISLPDNLYVEKFLNINRSKITSLPDNLYIGKNLHMRETKITSLPDDLYVGRNIIKDF